MRYTEDNVSVRFWVEDHGLYIQYREYNFVLLLLQLLRTATIVPVMVRCGLILNLKRQRELKTFVGEETYTGVIRTRGLSVRESHPNIITICLYYCLYCFRHRRCWRCWPLCPHSDMRVPCVYAVKQNSCANYRLVVPTLRIGKLYGEVLTWGNCY